MGKRVRNQGEQNKVQLGKGKRKEHPAVSFRYVTNNNKYSLKKALGDKEISLALVECIAEITSRSYEHFFSLPKGQGFETLPLYCINFSPNSLELSNDTKVIVHRFDKGKKRLIGFKDGQVLYVIGIDYDHTAYDHG